MLVEPEAFELNMRFGTSCWIPSSRTIVDSRSASSPSAVTASGVSSRNSVRFRALTTISSTRRPAPRERPSFLPACSASTWAAPASTSSSSPPRAPCVSMASRYSDGASTWSWATCARAGVALQRTGRIATSHAEPDARLRMFGIQAGYPGNGECGNAGSSLFDTKSLQRLGHSGARRGGATKPNVDASACPLTKSVSFARFLLHRATRARSFRTRVDQGWDWRLPVGGDTLGPEPHRRAARRRKRQ